MDVYRVYRSPILIIYKKNSLVLLVLCCIIGYCVISVTKAAINNTFIFKDCLCNFVVKLTYAC